MLVSSVGYFFLCFSLVTINRQTSYDTGIFRQDYGIIRGFIGHHKPATFVRRRYPSSRLRNHTRFADDSYDIWRLGHHLCITFTGPDLNGRAKLPHRTRLCGPSMAAIAGFNPVYNCKDFRLYRVSNCRPEF